MPAVECARCGETDDLDGERLDDIIVVTCGACGNAWERGTRPTCGLCGSLDLEGVPTSTLEEAGRAGVRTPSGIRIAHYCWTCLGVDVTSTVPTPGPNPPPGNRGRITRPPRPIA